MRYALIAAAAGGYLAGRGRPLEEARWRTEFTIRFGAPNDKPLGWRHVAAWAVLHPVRGTRSMWRAFGPGEEPPRQQEPVSLDDVFKGRA